MIIMSMMREKWRSEGRAREARLEARAEAAEGRAREARLEARVEAAEALAREAQALAREAQAKLDAQEVIRELRRQLREARGEGANGAADA